MHSTSVGSGATWADLGMPRRVVDSGRRGLDKVLMLIEDGPNRGGRLRQALADQLRIMVQMIQHGFGSRDAMEALGERLSERQNGRNHHRSEAGWWTHHR